MYAPRFTQIHATTVTDQAGYPLIVVLGLDAYGRVWSKSGDTNWKLLSAQADDPIEDEA